MPNTGLTTQLCGDAHLSNFGAYAAPDRRLVFDVNDFDETLPGPFEWDVKRLAASFAVAGRSRGFDASDREDINRTCVRAYREAMGEYSEMRELDVWYSRIDLEELFSRFARDAHGEGAGQGRAQHREDPPQGQPARVREADDDGRR